MQADVGDGKGDDDPTMELLLVRTAFDDGGGSLMLRLP